MNKDHAPWWLVWVVTIVMSICLCVLGISDSVSKFQLNKLKKDAIKLGYAQHNKKTGVWEWVEPKVITNGEKPQ